MILTNEDLAKVLDSHKRWLMDDEGAQRADLTGIDLRNADLQGFSLVCVEDLSVKGMLTNHKLARAISDIGWSEIGRQLGYKCAAVQEVGRFYPSSKLCNDCGAKADSMPLNVRSWTCKCGKVHDRDGNASCNIRCEGLRLFTASYAGNNACGDGSSGPGRKVRTKLPSLKQESRLSYLGIK